MNAKLAWHAASLPAPVCGFVLFLACHDQQEPTWASNVVNRFWCWHICCRQRCLRPHTNRLQITQHRTMTMSMLTPLSLFCPFTTPSRPPSFGLQGSRAREQGWAGEGAGKSAGGGSQPLSQPPALPRKPAPGFHHTCEQLAPSASALSYMCRLTSCSCSGHVCS